MHIVCVSTLCRNLKHCGLAHVHTVFSRIRYSQFSQKVSVLVCCYLSQNRRILRGKTETKSAPKTIFSGNGNGLKNFTFLSTREQKNVHTVYVKQDCVCVCVRARVQGWPYPPRTFFYRDNRSSGVSSLFSAVLGCHSCTKSMGMS